MKIAANCPQTEELRQLLGGSLAHERQQECTSHLESCTCCQARIEEIATDGTQLSQVIKNLHEVEPEATSAYWPALKSLTVDAPQTISPRTPPRKRELSLDFLGPPSDAADLGRLAQFDVMRILGRGGLCVVLEAFDSRLQRHVAL